MPAVAWRCYARSVGRDPPAERRRLSLRFALTLFIVSVGELFLIEEDVFLPGRLSHLLGVLHLFVRFGMVTVSFVICDRLFHSQLDKMSLNFNKKVLYYCSISINLSHGVMRYAPDEILISLYYRTTVTS
jgi:hypothetical protein